MIKQKEKQALAEAGFDCNFIKKCLVYVFPSGLTRQGFVQYCKDNEYLIRSN